MINWTPEHFLANRDSCSLALEDSEALEEIPSLNNTPLHDFKDGQLVKFRGMIQDMYNPEYYFEEYEVRNTQSGETDVRCGMFRDTARCSPDESIEMNSKKNKSSERQTCVVISIPGLNDWAKERSTSLKIESERNGTNVCIKRTLDEREDEQMECSESTKKKGRSSIEGIDQRSSEPVANVLSREHIMNFPIPNDEGKACIVKIYDENASYKLNQVLEIVGFISLDPLLSTIHDSDDTMDYAESHTHNPPVSLVPRLHAIKVIILTKHGIANVPQIVSKADCIRHHLHMVLSQFLFGDNLAADYLICHMISSVYARKDYLCLGSFPINIINFPIEKYKTFPRDLYEFLALLVPKSHYLEFTLDGLNDLNLIPKKDYECNRLTSGILQLSNNTHLVIDETKLTCGQVSQNGKRNYEAIDDLAKFQKVKYDFKFYTMEFEADIPVLILSEGKSLVPSVTQVSLKTDRETEDLYPQVVEAAKQYLKDKDRLNDIRQYLEILKHSDFRFNQEITDIIQEDFVKMRQADKSVNADNLHSLMVLARLMSLSHGIDTLSIDFWNKTIQMEAERVDRLSRRGK